MGIFFKFDCWGCDEIPCSCTRVERTPEYQEKLDKETTTTPVLKLHDVAVKDGKDWLVIEIQDDGIAIGREMTPSADKKEKRILEPYRKLVRRKLKKK